MPTQTESAIRRLAAKFGYVLRKARYRNPMTIGYGGYMLVDPERNWVIFGSRPYDYAASLDDVEDFLSR